MDSQRMCLDRYWRFTKTPQTVLPKFITHDTIYTYAKGDGAQGPALLNFNDAGWEPVDLPHDWQHTEPFDMTSVVSHGYQHTGVGWYRRTFLLDPEDEQGEITLVFDGISGISDVYVNGVKLRHNESCYNGFALPLTDIANFSATPNVIAVRVDKTVWEGWWYEGCGINRHVWLLKRPFLHIADDGVWIKPKKSDGRWSAALEWTLENTGETDLEGVLEAEVQAPSGETAAKVSLPVRAAAYSLQTVRVECELDSPVLWDIENPNLYTLQTTMASAVGRDTNRKAFGLRETAFDPQYGFFLNGHPVKLLGVCCHQDHAGVGAAIPADLWRYRIGLLKAMGCNAYRCSHNPPPRELLDICDELGVLVMDENRSFSTSDASLSLLRDMVRRDRNHPCVILYSLFNEEPLQGTPKGRRIAKRQRAEVRKLDDTRPCTGALNAGMFEPGGAATVLDVTGINYCLDGFDRFHALFPEQPLISSEDVSAFATRGCMESDETAQVFGNYDEDCADWGATVRETNTMVLSRPFVAGLFAWTGFDYRGEPTPYEWPSVSSHFGIMDTCGFPKDTYYLYRAYWTREPRIHILPHWNHRRGAEVRVMAYTNCEEAELFLNGQSLGRQPVDRARQPDWRVRYKPGELRAVGYRGGEPVVEDTVRTAGRAKRFVPEAPVPFLFRDTDSVGIINLSCEDIRGVFCPLENTRLTVTVNGGKLLGVGNGDPNSHALDSEPTVRLFNGRAQVLVAAEAGAREVAVTFSSTRFGDVAITLPVHRRPFPEDVPRTDMQVLAGWHISHTAQPEKPEINPDMSQSDIRSMEPVNFTGTGQPQFDGHPGEYALYHTRADVGASARGRFLVLNAVQGTVEIYAGDRLLGSRECFGKSRVEMELPVTLCNEVLFSLIIKNDTVDHRAGLMEPVCMVQR